jgi:integrase
MEDIKEYINKKRPTLSASSINTYCSILKNLYKRVYGDDKYELSKFDEPTKTIEHLEGMPPNKRKTILSALVIITDNGKYRELMMDDVKNYNKEIDTQTKSETQKENWVSADQIKEIYDEFRSNADLLYKKKNLTPTDLQNIQQYIILALLSGIYIPPRRAKDFVDFMITDADKQKDNYLEKNKMYFNSYKTAKTYGQQTVVVPPALLKIIKKWIAINPTTFLLFDNNLHKLSSVKLNQRINKIFDGKKVSVNNFRHTFLTDKFGHTIEQKKIIDNTMEEMGSSANMLDTYVKK